jgi:hypothetical protein
MPDTSNLKPGDVVHVRATFQTAAQPDARSHRVVFDSGDFAWVAPADIVHVEPRQLQVGDTVRVKNFNYRYVIRFIDDDGVALLRPEDRKHAATHGAVSVEQLERADA